MSSLLRPSPTRKSVDLGRRDLATASGGGGGIANLVSPFPPVAIGTVTLNIDDVKRNSSPYGDGIVDQGTLALGGTSDTSVNGNTAPDGGGIWNNLTLDLTNASVNANTAINGGGIYSQDAILTLTNSSTVNRPHGNERRRWHVRSGPHAVWARRPLRSLYRASASRTIRRTNSSPASPHRIGNARPPGRAFLRSGSGRHRSRSRHFRGPFLPSPQLLEATIISGFKSHRHPTAGWHSIPPKEPQRPRPWWIPGHPPPLLGRPRPDLPPLAFVWHFGAAFGRPGRREVA
jgi:predicted outer membrane repeat protein